MRFEMALMLAVLAWPFASMAQQPAQPAPPPPSSSQPRLGLDGANAPEAQPTQPIPDRKSSAAGDTIDKTKLIDPPPRPPSMPR